MSKKYIKQVSSNNFIYPNNTLEEYDIEIIHNINSNVVSGSISGFTAVASGSNIIVSFSYNWNLNGAEPYINSTNNLSILSVHMMASNVQYFKPWRMIGFVQDGNVNLTTKSGSVSYTVTPQMLGVNTFLTGTYNLEIRMIGKLEVQPICVQASLLAPTPTPTATSTTPTPTPTITPTRVTPTPTNTPSATSGGGGGSYRYYLIDKYQCHLPSNPCTLYESDLIGRVTYPVSLTNGYYYNPSGDGFVYLVNSEIASTGWTVDLDGSASSGNNCIGTCNI